jgi:hypothetical protein
MGIFWHERSIVVLRYFTEDVYAPKVRLAEKCQHLDTLMQSQHVLNAPTVSFLPGGRKT